MFLNYKRIPLAYILLSVFTLGFYSTFFRKELASDLNTACGKNAVKIPSAKFLILNTLSFGVYATLWDIEFLKLCREYIEENGEEFTADLDSYKFFGMIPLVRYKTAPELINEINLVCRIYSDKQLEDVDVHDILGVKRVRDITSDVDEIYAAASHTRKIELDFSEEAKQNKLRLAELGGSAGVSEQSSKMIAGYAVIEEYDPEKDQRRIGYLMRFKREDDIADKEAQEQKQLEEEQQRQREQEELEKERRALQALNCYRGKKWLRKTVILLLSVFILPFVMIAVTVFAMPPVYDETYTGALADKYELLNKTEGKKIIIIGGSSVALGINSDLISDEFSKYKVINFGLSSELGIKAMLDLSRSGIGEDDIIIIAPELTDSGLSLNFNGEEMLKALDGNLGLLMNIESEDYASLIGSSLSFASDKMSYLVNKSKPVSAREAYLAKNIDAATGDNTYERDKNEAFGVYGEISLDLRADLKDSKVTEYDKFIEYINEYTHYAERKGATVYYSFAPICKQALAYDVTDSDISLYYSNLASVLQCKIISDIRSYIFDEEYFYDSELTLNDAGANIRTVKLIDDLKRVCDDSSLTFTSGLEIEPSGFATVTVPSQTVSETEKDTENAELFVFELCDFSYGEYYAVIGLTEKGKLRESVTVPTLYEGKPVVKISENAFKDSSILKNVYLGGTVCAIDKNAFSGSTVTGVYIPKGKKPGDIKIAGAGQAAILGADPMIRFYVAEDDVALYKNDTGFFGCYKDYIKGI